MALIRSRLPQRLGTTGFIWRKRAAASSGVPGDALLLDSAALTLNGSTLTLD